MKRIKVLDCTLRDGGYINDFRFGREPMKSIVALLCSANIDIVECGFLREGERDNGKSLFGTVEAAKDIIGTKERGRMYVAMLQYGAMGVKDVPDCDGSAVDGIRVSFHEYEISPAFRIGDLLAKKGYKIFLQPVGTMIYTNEELLELINRANELHPYAFYIVDTLGSIYPNDLHRMISLADQNLREDIWLGFHSHNNLQMSFTNTREILQRNTTRRLIVDSSVMGMGRGAGNLCTELIVHYLNENYGGCYDELKIMEIMDKYILPLRQEYTWGYDPAYGLGAMMKCHPNYVHYLLEKTDLNLADIHRLLQQLNPQKKHLFRKESIEEIYVHCKDNT